MFPMLFFFSSWALFIDLHMEEWYELLATIAVLKSIECFKKRAYGNAFILIASSLSRCRSFLTKFPLMMMIHKLMRPGLRKGLILGLTHRLETCIYLTKLSSSPLVIHVCQLQLITWTVVLLIELFSLQAYLLSSPSGSPSEKLFSGKRAFSKQPGIHWIDALLCKNFRHHSLISFLSSGFRMRLISFAWQYETIDDPESQLS